MISKPILDEQQLGAAAFDLLSCSSLGRYARVARANAASLGLAANLRADAVTQAAVFARADELWTFVSSQTERGLEEMELAVILAAIESMASTAQWRELITKLATHKGEGSRWISSLARRHFLQHQPHRTQRDVAWRGGKHGSHRKLQEMSCI